MLRHLKYQASRCARKILSAAKGHRKQSGVHDRAQGSSRGYQIPARLTVAGLESMDTLQQAIAAREKSPNPTMLKGPGDFIPGLGTKESNFALQWRPTGA